MTHVPNNAAAARFAFDNTYARELEGFYVTWEAAQVARPRVVTSKTCRSELDELREYPGLTSEDKAALLFSNSARFYRLSVD